MKLANRLNLANLVSSISLQIEGLQFEKRFTVVERNQIRQRPLP